MTLAIQTNNQERPVIFWDTLTPKQRGEFDYDSAKDSCFVVYKGWPYDIGEFMAVREMAVREYGELSPWHGYSSDSFFSGVLIKFISDCDTVIMGRYTS